MTFIILSILFWWLLSLYAYNHPVKLISNKNYGGGGSTEVTSHTYYYYRIKFPHNSIDPSQSIIFYDAYGTIVYTLPPYYQFMNYGEGILAIPGTEQNVTIESISTATYYVFYSSDDLVIDYEKAEFKISKSIIKSTANTDVKGTFEYLSIITPFKDVASIIDGRWDTQVQTEFFSPPPTGYNYAILDLGSVKTIQALDIVSGFYKPDDIRRYDVDFTITIQYSLDGTNYYDISDKTHSIQFTGGQSKSFEEEDLGVGFTARYLKILLQNVKRIDYSSLKDSTGTIIREGIYVVAFTEVAAYDNIIIKSEATLIPTTELTQDINLSGLVSGSFPSTINVKDTTGFSSSGTAYIYNSDGSFDSFTYTGKGGSFFYGVSGLGEDHTNGDMVVQSVEADSTLYDYDGLRPKLGDRIYKVNKVNDGLLFNQTQLDYVAKKYLYEFMKNHSKASIEVMYSPHIEIGQTLQVIDADHAINTKYFIEEIKDNNGSYTLTIARYPS